MRSNQVFGAVEGVYNREQYIKKKKELRKLLWQPLDTKSNDHTSNKSLRQISSGKFTRELDKEPLLNQSLIY